MFIDSSWHPTALDIIHEAKHPRVLGPQTDDDDDDLTRTDRESVINEDARHRAHTAALRRSKSRRGLTLMLYSTPRGSPLIPAQRPERVRLCSGTPIGVKNQQTKPITSIFKTLSKE